MALRRQTQVMAAMDGLAGRSVARVAKDYRHYVVKPMVRRIGKAASLEGLLAQFGPGLVEEMDTGVLIESLTDVTVQAGAIGYVSAVPGEKSKVKGRRSEGRMRNGETSKVKSQRSKVGRSNAES